MNVRISPASRVAAAATVAVILLANSANAQTSRTEKRFNVQGNPVVTVHETPAGISG